MNRACFPKEKHQNSRKWAKFMNFSFWPFIWFGLQGRLLTEALLEIGFWQVERHSHAGANYKGTSFLLTIEVFLLASALGKWAWTQMGSDGFNWI